MRIKEITAWLEEQYPQAMAEDWDNVGLLVGDDSWEVHKVLLALDATEEVIREACERGADLVITHHPMIFGGMKKINNHTALGRKVLTLAEHHIGYFAMHTNYDILGMAELSASLLKLQDAEVLSPSEEWQGVVQGLGRVGALEKPQTLREFGAFVKEQLALSDVRIYGDPEAVVSRAAVCTGSGKSLLSDVYRAKADVYVTGDIDHHTALDAVEAGLMIVDAGHYGTEYVFAEAMKKKLAEQFPELGFEVAAMKAPYEVL